MYSHICDILWFKDKHDENNYYISKELDNLLHDYLIKR